VLRAALPRSVTSPVGLSIAEALQASVPLAVVLTMVSGVLGAAFGPALLSLARVRDDRARGFAVGLTSHGIGTSRVLADSTVAGGWSSAAMVLNALVMTVVLPIVAAVATGCADGACASGLVCRGPCAGSGLHPRPTSQRLVRALRPRGARRWRLTRRSVPPIPSAGERDRGNRGGAPACRALGGGPAPASRSRWGRRHR